MRLTVKLPAVIVGATLITAVAGSLLSIGIGRNVLREAALGDSFQRVEIYASAVHYYLENARAMVSTTAGLPELGSPVRARKVAGLMLAQSDVFEYLTLLTPEGGVAMQEPHALEEQLSHRDLSFSAWFKEVRNMDRTVVSDLHISPATQRPAVVIATPVRAPDGRTIAYWAGALKLDRLSQIGSEAASRSARGGAGYLTDRRGLVIAHQTRPGYVQQQTDFSSVPPVAAALAGRTGSEENLNPIEQERRLASYLPLPGIGWAAVYSFPAAAALASLDNLTFGILSAALALAVLMGAGMFVLARRIAAPLARLAAAAQTVGTGDFSQRIEAAGGDEIGQLGTEFNRMAGALSEKEAQARRYAAALEASNRELDAFAYSVSHDLRAPLRSMDGFALVLLEDYGGKLDDEGKDALSRIRSASQRMGNLIDDLLRLSQVTRSDMRLHQVDLSALSRAIAERLRQAEPARQVRWEIEGGLETRADPALIEIALRNLIENAWKFTGKTARPVIRVGVREQDGKPVFFVADNGTGFDMAHADRLFGAFQRLHHAADFPGTGIGLAIVQRVIRRHAGEVWARAKPGEGATFFFRTGNAKEASRG